MKILISFLIFNFSIIQIILSQQSVKGIVRDYEFGDSIPGVKIFVDTTNYFQMDLYGMPAFARKTDGTYKKIMMGISSKSGTFQIDSIQKKRVNLIFSVDRYEYFVIENVVFNNENIDLGEIFMFRSSYMGDGRKEIKDSTGKVVRLEAFSYSNEGMFSRDAYKNLKEVTMPYPVFGIRKKIKMSRSCLVMNYEELIRKK